MAHDLRKSLVYALVPAAIILSLHPQGKCSLLACRVTQSLLRLGIIKSLVQAEAVTDSIVSSSTEAVCLQQAALIAMQLPQDTSGVFNIASAGVKTVCLVAWTAVLRPRELKYQERA